MASKKETTKIGYLEVDSDMKTSMDDDDYSYLANCTISELLNPMSSTAKKILPNQGFCVKAKTEDGTKIFINVCHHPDMPFPEELKNASSFFEGGKLQKSLDPFPLSLGEPHVEVDKSGMSCQCYDVVVNSDCFKRTEDFFYQDIVMSLSVAGIERKYGISIEIESCKVLNKKYHGTMPSHFIKVKPVTELSSTLPAIDDNDKLSFPNRMKSIQEFQDSEMKVVSFKPAKKFTDSSCAESQLTACKLFEVPHLGKPSLYIFQASLPATQISKNIMVRVSKFKLVIRQHLFKKVMTFLLPVDYKKSLANVSEGKLVVVMPISSCID